MSYKHIVGDLYEFQEEDGALVCVRMAKVVGFSKSTENASWTVVDLGITHSPYLLIVDYEDFKGLMEMYVKLEMIERARMSYPISVPSVFDPTTVYKETESKWEVSCEGEQPTRSITVTEGKTPYEIKPTDGKKE